MRLNGLSCVGLGVNEVSLGPAGPSVLIHPAWRSVNECFKINRPLSHTPPPSLAFVMGGLGIGKAQEERLITVLVEV